MSEVLKYLAENEIRVYLDDHYKVYAATPSELMHADTQMPHLTDGNTPSLNPTNQHIAQDTWTNGNIHNPTKHNNSNSIAVANVFDPLAPNKVLE
jgi:hypothetical protein